MQDEREVERLKEKVKELTGQRNALDKEIERLRDICAKAHRSLAVATSTYIALAKLIGERHLKEVGQELPSMESTKAIFPKIFNTDVIPIPKDF